MIAKQGNTATQIAHTNDVFRDFGGLGASPHF